MMDDDMPNPGRRYSRKAAARYLTEVWGIPTAASTLAKAVCVGGSPKYRKAGRTVLYDQAALDEYARTRLSRSVRSTSEYGRSLV